MHIFPLYNRPTSFPLKFYKAPDYPLPCHFLFLACVLTAEVGLATVVMEPSLFTHFIFSSCLEYLMGLGCIKSFWCDILVKNVNSCLNCYRCKLYKQKDEQKNVASCSNTHTVQI